MSGRFDSCIGGHEAEAKRASRSVVPREPPPSNSLWARLLASGLEAGRAVIRSILLEFIDGPKERMTAPRDGLVSGSRMTRLPAGIIDGPAARSPNRPKGTGGGPTTGTVKNRIRLSVILLIILL